MNEVRITLASRKTIRSGSASILAQPGRDSEDLTRLCEVMATVQMVVESLGNVGSGRWAIDRIMPASGTWMASRCREDIARQRDQYRQGWDRIREARWRRMKEMGIIHTVLSTLERDVGPPYVFPEDVKKLGPGEVTRLVPWTELTAELREFQATKMAIHAARVDRMDQEIGHLLAQLR